MMRTLEIVRTAALVLLALAAAWVATLVIDRRGGPLTGTDLIALLRVFLSWPVLVGVFIIVFRQQIKTMLLGIRRVLREGIEFGAQDQLAKVDEARRLSATVVTPTAAVKGRADTRLAVPRRARAANQAISAGVRSSA